MLRTDYTVTGMDVGLEERVEPGFDNLEALVHVQSTDI